jgi:hypothetical protein
MQHRVMVLSNGDKQYRSAGSVKRINVYEKKRARQNSVRVKLSARSDAAY